MTNLEKAGASAFGRLGGKAKSAAKTKAARENAKRPRGKRKRFTGTTVEGVLLNCDGSPHVGEVTFLPMSTPSVIGCNVVLIAPGVFSTDESGRFEFGFFSGEYVLRFSGQSVRIRIPQRMSGHAVPRRLPMRVALTDVTIS